jgi:phosphotransferase system HPr-like phosphotransfer protein
MAKTATRRSAIRRIPDNNFYDLVCQRDTLLKTEDGIRTLAGVARGSDDWKNDEHYTGLHYALSSLSGSRDPEDMRLLAGIFRDPKRREIVASTKTDDGYSALQSALNDEILKDLASGEEGRQYLLRSLRGKPTGVLYMMELAKLYGAKVHIDEENMKEFDVDSMFAIAEKAITKGPSIHIDAYGPKRDARALDLSKYGQHIGTFRKMATDEVRLRLAVTEYTFTGKDPEEKIKIANNAILTDYWSLVNDFERHGTMVLFGAMQDRVFGPYYAAAAIEYPAILDVTLGERSSDQPLLDVYNSNSYTLAYHIAVHAPLQVAVRLLEKLNETTGKERRNYLYVLSKRICDNVCDSFDYAYNGPSVFETVVRRLREVGPLLQSLADNYESKFGAEVGSFARKSIELPKPPLTKEAKSTIGVFVHFWGLDDLSKLKRADRT